MTAASTVEQLVGTALLAAVDYAREHGGVFLHSDLQRAAELASAVRRGGALTTNQAREAWRILNRAELDDTGVTAPRLPRPDDLPVGTAPPSAHAPNAPVVRLRTDGAWRGIAVTNSYPFKDTLKALGAKPYKRDGAFEWRLPATPAAATAVLDALAGAHPRASAGVVALAGQHQDGLDARAVLDESAPLPVFDTAMLIKPEFSLWDHQVRGVDFLCRSTASLQAIPMGGGKTLATITAVNKLEAKRVLIVSPNKVRGVWPREVRKFSAQQWHIVSGFRPSKRAKSGRMSLSLPDRLRQAEECLFDCGCGAPTHAVVINYEAFGHEPWASWQPQVPLDLAVYDEIQKLKSPTGVISKNVARLVQATRRRVGLSGTPMPQTPLDVFGIYRALDPGIFGTKWTAFRSTYAVMNPHVDGHVVGYRNVEELRDKVYTIMYRPVVDLKLPEITDVTREFPLEPKARKVYDSVDTQLWADLSEFTGKPVIDFDEERFNHAHQMIDEGRSGDEILRYLDDEAAEAGEEGSTSEVTAANTMVRLLRLQQLTGGTVIDDDGTRIRVSTGKAELLEETLDDVGCVSGGDADPEPVVVFCRFRSDLDATREIAEKKGLRYAEVSGRRHDGLTHDSEMNPDCDVVGVQLQSGGTGVDLTRARVMIWYSMGYSLSDYDQARKRLHRPGQTRPVVSIHLLAEDTADMDVYEALANRRSVVHRVLERHGIDGEKLGFGEDFQLDAEQVAMMDAGKGAVSLPFDRLLGDKTMLGEPGKK